MFDYFKTQKGDIKMTKLYSILFLALVCGGIGIVDAKGMPHDHTEDRSQERESGNNNYGDHDGNENKIAIDIKE